MYIDRMDYHHEPAYEQYMNKFKKDEEELTEEDSDTVEYYAGNHIGFFLNWIIQNHFMGKFSRL
ncbi:DUF7832 domain-containing protein [Oceanobacillus sojae]|uniref:DUF7832 domain-containing protein n=1 Tax=Oceanobacillus sojae TaxID=582851 RepID=UPI0009883E96|nr:hypothetical protein [Oceanobacillus sojae]MCT1905362.1 hypothetical protein [Oceanobacillus sojae]